MSDDLFPAEPKILGVSELTRRIRDLLENGVGEVWVEGEISNHRLQSSGHHYFTLKDDRSQLSCVLFARSAGRQKLADGMAVQIFGEVTVYEARGQYQMIVKLVQPRGVGVLQAKFEALKRRLEAEGLFDPARKRALPKFPRRVGIVTSPTGAALQDMLNILTRRAPWLEIRIHPVKVQGDGAAAEIAAAVRDFGRRFTDGPDRVDLIVVARGGGSLEDLWAFNEEVVARAIYESPLPVVSAVGHEIDFSIADFVADLRAPTPSAAAELIAPDGMELRRRLDQMGQRLRYLLQSAALRQHERLERRLAPALVRETGRQLVQRQQAVDGAAESLGETLRGRLEELQRRQTQATATLQRYRPRQVLEMKRHGVDLLESRLGAAWERSFALRRQAVERAGNLLRVLGPQSVLERGFTITTMEDGRIPAGAVELRTGQKIRTRFHDGEAASIVAGE